MATKKEIAEALEHVRRSKARGKAQSAATRKLRTAHKDEYDKYYQEELAKNLED